MLMPTLSILGLVAAAAASCPNDLQTPYPAPVADGNYTVRLVANAGLSKPRSLLFDNGGALLVLDSNVGVVRMTLEDHGGSCVTVANTTKVLEDKALNHGMQLSPDGTTLYVSTSNDVRAYAYDSSSGTVGEPRVVVTGMDNAMHKTRTLLLTSGGDLLVSRGSAANSDLLAQDEGSGHCQIRSFDPSATGTNFTSGALVGWGLRNSVGIGERDGEIWSVENSADNLARMGTDIHNTNPAEELNYHGSVGNYTGKNFGYPACYTAWDAQVIPAFDKGTGDAFAVNLSSDAQCNDSERARLPLPAHTAPLDIVFDKDGHAWISLHGSWNADPPVGYALVRVPFEGAQPRADYSAKDGFEEIVTSPDLEQCPGKCWRPVGLAWDKKGRLFVASDTTKEIFVVLPKSEDEQDGDGSAAIATRPSAWLAVAALGAWIFL